MDPVKIIAFGGIAMIVSGIVGAFVAGMKNRLPNFWGALCFLIPPALLVLLILPKNRGPAPRRRSLDAEDHHDW